MRRRARRFRRAARCAVAVAALLVCAGGADAARRSELLDPVGAWKCVLYGHPELGDERVLLRLRPDGSAALAHVHDDGDPRWLPLSSWRAERHVLTFRDFRTGREFEGDLRRETLGGTWRTLSLLGGWWCNAIEDGGADVDGESYRADVAMPPLIPERMATPRYPTEAIRRAKQGRAVACFFVAADGTIFDPVIIELTDEVFRKPTLEALERSSYRSLGEGTAARPGCRSFIYRLDSSL